MTHGAEAYRSREPLAARMNIYRWQRDPVDLPGLAVAELSGVRGTVTDIGCGVGGYTDRLRAQRPDLRVLPLDRSPAMAADALADIRYLPLADGSADAALAMHMLYHLEEPGAAIGELRRVLRPGGTLLASTNGAGDKAEIAELWAAALRDLLGAEPEPYANPAAGFTLDHGHLFEPHFAGIELREFARETVVPEPGPMIAFLHSLRGLAEGQLPDGIGWPDFLDRAAALVCRRIEETGAFRLTNRFGLFVCR
ncbi:class I SAM-dependent methyltransferase [Sciscionella sediminilitoris]|uniref:class I SAM-dependent methyltransferase n=1 Tax=Sciscionella sediminilitoris TaxID=1445613 RepID=UPI0012E2CD74|nr:class I SAM-dependent methyltransferase [Sciscionella sp. SE31]